MKHQAQDNKKYQRLCSDNNNKNNNMSNKNNENDSISKSVTNQTKVAALVY